jgi:hypothetical protein
VPPRSRAVEVPIPVDPVLLDRVLRSLEEELRLEADLKQAERRMRQATTNLRR